MRYVLPSRRARNSGMSGILPDLSATRDAYLAAIDNAQLPVDCAARAKAIILDVFNTPRNMTPEEKAWLDLLGSDPSAACKPRDEDSFLTKNWPWLALAGAGGVAIAVATRKK